MQGNQTKRGWLRRASDGHHAAGRGIDASSEAAPREAAHMLSPRGRRGLEMGFADGAGQASPPGPTAADPAGQKHSRPRAAAALPCGPGAAGRARPAGGAPAARPARVTAVTVGEALCLSPLRLKGFPGQDLRGGKQTPCGF